MNLTANLTKCVFCIENLKDLWGSSKELIILGGVILIIPFLFWLINWLTRERPEV